ncbi:MAG: DNA-directed RNA polymerase specialized sigma24 family protein, partial [Hyphomicrobiaceae bacterium]
MSNSQVQDRDSLGLLLGQKMWLHRCALRMGYRTESAEDAVQETFLLASQSESRSLGLGWLRRTLQRQLGMQLRSERRRSKREQQAAKPEALHLDPAGPLEQLEFQREIQRSVAQLP